MQSRRKVKQSAGRHGEAFWGQERQAGSFGIRMMEKMGWSQGQGLGKSENGSTKFVRAKQKKDMGGIGNEKDTDASFHATQGLFNDLLKRLNQSGEDTDFDPSAEPEEKPVLSNSQALKTFIAKRTLYTRFKKSKDVSSYSAKDMAEIFGRPTEPEKKVEKKAVSTRAVDQSILTTTSNVSMRDYFAKKLQQGGARVSRFQTASGNGFTENQQENYYHASMTAATSGKRGLGFGGSGWSNVDQDQKAAAYTGASGFVASSTFYVPPSATPTEAEESVPVPPSTKKKKKRAHGETTAISDQPPLKKVKKAKRKAEPVSTQTIVPAAPAVVQKKKKKKKKSKRTEEPVPTQTIVPAAAPAAVQKKKKKKSRVSEAPPVTTNTEPARKKKKKKAFAE